jgi:hypothetical protein
MPNEIHTPLQLIRDQGDLLERQIFADEDFAGCFDLYPLVWTRCVLVNRVPGKLALQDLEWLRFAERHYSVIIRCWMAYIARKDIDRLCTDAVDAPSALQHLQLHRLLFEYYCSLGAAIDNMRYAFQSEPINAVDAFGAIYDRADIQANLRYLYERRTQYIHKAIVPCFNNEGLLSLDAAMFNDTDTHWDNRYPLNLNSASSLCDFHWAQFVDEMRGAWSTLLELLRSRRWNLPGEIDFTPLEPRELEWSSASPHWPRGWPNL